MNERTDEGMNEGMNECMNERMNEGMSQINRMGNGEQENRTQHGSV